MPAVLPPPRAPPKKISAWGQASRANCGPRLPSARCWGRQMAWVGASNGIGGLVGRAVVPSRPIVPLPRRGRLLRRDLDDVAGGHLALQRHRLLEPADPFRQEDLRADAA